MFIKLIMFTIKLKRREVVVLIDLLHFGIITALYEDAAAWNQCAGRTDNFKCKVQNFSRSDVRTEFRSIFLFCDVFAKLSDQNKVNRLRIFETTGCFDLRFRKPLGNQRLMRKSEVSVYFDLTGIECGFIYDEVNRTPSSFQKGNGFGA